jgi:hypothetical protein
MYRLDSRSDWIVYLLMFTLVTAMGIAFLVFPAEPLPTQPEAYAHKAGVLDVVIARSSLRRGAWAQFQLVGDPVVYESRAFHINESAAGWQPQKTALSFHVVRESERSGTRSDPEIAYGLVADGVATGSLAAEIERLNAASDRAGMFALAIGLLGFAAALLAWLRRRGSAGFRGR